MALVTKTKGGKIKMSEGKTAVLGLVHKHTNLNREKFKGIPKAQFFEVSQYFGLPDQTPEEQVANVLSSYNDIARICVIAESLGVSGVKAMVKTLGQQ